MTGKRAVLVPEEKPHYRVLGPLIKSVPDHAIVWGAGSWGVEARSEMKTGATFLSVRGPLTRWKLKRAGIDCPPIYGDPALLLPQFYRPKPIGERFEVGVVFRWSEREWADGLNTPGVKNVEIRSDDVEGTIDQICACDRIVTTSLHVVIAADVYGVPSAWLKTNSTHGGEFKFLDYFLTVNAIRLSQQLDPLKPGLTLQDLLSLNLSDRPIEFDPRPMI